jgi:hypothetical protein
MSIKRKTPAKISTTSSALMPISVDVDLVRFEKNLLQIGFFGANDARDKNRTSRRIEQIVHRNGHKIKVAAEFRGSELLGLPSTTDRDKFIALLKIISEDRARTGQIDNPIRFSGYRLIQELGLSRNGEIYEEILKWGKRMTDTTITSEQVVYRAAKKVYSDEVLHVFRSFRRTGSSNLNGAEKQEHYEVVLEDWLLENLNQRYVIPEDFNAYKQLARPTAKGIFGNLHLWFHASQGRQVEKDYAELCNLLNVQAYPHLSKIKSTMGLALNELVKIRYISRWEILPMSSKLGYKIVLQAGEELLRVLDNSRPERREVLDLGQTLLGESNKVGMTGDQQEAFAMLERHGILPAKAGQLVQRFGSDSVMDTVEYLEGQMTSGKRRNIENPAGLIIYSLENGLPVPAGFMSARRRKELQESARLEETKRQARLEAEMAYERWIEREQQAAVSAKYSERALQLLVEKIVAERTHSDESFRRVPQSSRPAVAMQIIRKEVRQELVLPSFEEWWASSSQIDLFS